MDGQSCISSYIQIARKSLAMNIVRSGCVGQMEWPSRFSKTEFVIWDGFAQLSTIHFWPFDFVGIVWLIASFRIWYLISKSYHGVWLMSGQTITRWFSNFHQIRLSYAIVVFLLSHLLNRFAIKGFPFTDYSKITPSNLSILRGKAIWRKRKTSIESDIKRDIKSHRKIEKKSA